MPSRRTAGVTSGSPPQRAAAAGAATSAQMQPSSSSCSSAAASSSSAASARPPSAAAASAARWVARIAVPGGTHALPVSCHTHLQYPHTIPIVTGPQHPSQCPHPNPKPNPNPDPNPNPNQVRHLLLGFGRGVAGRPSALHTHAHRTVCSAAQLSPGPGQLGRVLLPQTASSSLSTTSAARRSLGARCVRAFAATSASTTRLSSTTFSFAVARLTT